MFMSFCRDRRLGKGLAAVMLFTLNACSPVDFSADSNTIKPEATPTPTVTPPQELVDMKYTGTVQATSKKLDIVLIIDDSNSMLQDNQKLATRLSGFVGKLQTSNIDWQMCVTPTRALVLGGAPRWGASFHWQNYTPSNSAPAYILKSGTSNLNAIFSSTIDYIGAGYVNSDDERAIKAAYHHADNGDYRYSASGCYRPDAAIAFIIISDEDERSIGGDLSQKYYQSEGLDLENEDKPEHFVSFMKNTFGNDKRFTVNSIIVKPGDSDCMASQDAGGAKSHYGVQYAALSNMTGGGVGSICAEDYSAHLNLFFDKIEDSLRSIPLECPPVGNIKISITPAMGPVASRVEGANLIFDTAIPAGRSIKVDYQCYKNTRFPSSLKGAPELLQEGFFAKILNFFRNLF